MSLTPQQKAVLYAIPYVLAIDTAADEVGVTPTAAYSWCTDNTEFAAAVERMQSLCPVDKPWYWHIKHRILLLLRGDWEGGPY